MKKYLLCITMLVAGAISAKAQVTVGAKAGVNFSKINADNVDESSITGYQIGAFARLGSDWYFQPELYLASSGGKFKTEDNNNTVTVDGKVKFTTLNVPLLIGKTFGSEDLNLRLNAGPVYTYIMDDNRNLGGNISDAFNNYKSSALGYQVGGGIDVGKISIDLRYEGGLTKVNDYFDQRQNLWSLAVGFKIF
ncbi:PorT family protein [Mucilaginibacter limnophilus]|uniref:PorT family protein n=1 Tax=Mucilaginibacter limnophilus TaxID=1932778 RepID=A0A3S2UNB5_9SPHI|nr:porin family protein [Mucilaginibacter limnophilus]RVU01947.1 PorT family protein [Mucilaginibacter limnophilus]